MAVWVSMPDREGNREVRTGVVSFSIGPGAGTHSERAAGRCAGPAGDRCLQLSSMHVPHTDLSSVQGSILGTKGAPDGRCSILGSLCLVGTASVHNYQHCVWSIAAVLPE